MDVDGHLRRHAAGQHGLEVSPCQPVLALEEERPGELEAHPHQFGMVDQDGAEGLDGLVVEVVALGVAAGLYGQFQRLHAEIEQPGRRIVYGVALFFLGVGNRRQHQARQQGGQHNSHQVLALEKGSGGSGCDHGCRELLRKEKGTGQPSRLSRKVRANTPRRRMAFQWQDCFRWRTSGAF